MGIRNLFEKLYKCENEDAVDQLIAKHPQVFAQENWYPYGENEGSFGVIENQQASPIPALIEKITNSIDAVLMKRCFEEDMEPKSSQAPKTMEEAVLSFFPNSKNWDLPSFRKLQAENIQIIADGPRMDTSLIIYDDGEGQHPEKFEDTFLSLLRGNKNEIPFVQGKYNMGGSGTLIFCGKKRYQLIASKRFDNTGKFGFTLVRKHPLSETEKTTKKNTWYEFLKINGEIPAFDINELDLGLYNRKFKTGTIIKLYSYDLPSGSRSVITRDLNRSLNEYLFQPALPIYTIDKEERYPKDYALQRELYGLKRRLEEENSKKYIETSLSLDFTDKEFGELYVTCYLFKPLVEEKTVTESRRTIQDEFFKNNMAVLFSLNGQVHGHYTSEFITRSLKYPLFKDYLLIHVDCTKLEYDFRNELFMASRDRIKGGEESRQLREKLATYLKKSRLDELYKNRKDAISVGTNEANDLLKSFTRNLPLNSDLMKLLSQTYKIDGQKTNSNNPNHKPKSPQKEKPDFVSNRFPSFLRLDKKNDGITPVAQIPIGGERTLKFLTDVENEYFDRIEDPGTLEIELLNFSPNDTTGGNAPGTPKKVEEAFNVVKTSPHEGMIKIVLAPTDEVKVGDALQIKATLTSAGEDFDQIFWVKIIEKEKPLEKPTPQPEKEDMGLPECIRVYKDEREDCITWDKLKNGSVEMSYETIMYPYAEGDKLEKIYVNMDSTVLKNFRSKIKGGVEAYQIADSRYVSAVYFHTLFLYTISKNRKYSFSQGEENDERDLTDYLKDVFESYYTSFLLNFGTEQLMQSFE